MTSDYFVTERVSEIVFKTQQTTGAIQRWSHGLESHLTYCDFKEF